MEIFSFIIGFALGIYSLSMERLILLFKIIFSFGISYIIISPCVNIWTIEKYTWENVFEFFKTLICWIDISLTVFNFYFFYWFIPLLLDRFMKKYIEKITYKLINRCDHVFSVKFTKWFIKRYWKYVKFSKKYRILVITDKIESNEINHKKNLEDIYTFISLLIHSSVCFIFISPINNYVFYLIPVFILFISIVLFFAMPITKYFYSYMVKILNNEFNRDQQQVP